MEYTIPVKETNKVNLILKLFSLFAPFSKMSKVESEIASKYISEYYRLRETVNEDEISAILFEYAFTKKVSDDLDMSMHNVRNYITRLRKKGIIDGRSLSENVIKLFDSVDNEVVFKLKIVD